jgi:hypothetical protein
MRHRCHLSCCPTACPGNVHQCATYTPLATRSWGGGSLLQPDARHPSCAPAACSAPPHGVLRVTASACLCAEACLFAGVPYLPATQMRLSKDADGRELWAARQRQGPQPLRPVRIPGAGCTHAVPDQLQLSRALRVGLLRVRQRCVQGAAQALRQTPASVVRRTGVARPGWSQPTPALALDGTVQAFLEATAPSRSSGSPLGAPATKCRAAWNGCHAAPRARRAIA